MAGQSKIVLHFPDKLSFADKKFIVLGGDAGGTKVNLALFEATPSDVKMIKSSSYHSGSFPSVNKILQQFLQENPDFKPEKICLGVAGPVFEGRVAVTNLPWHIDANEIAAATGVNQVVLLNDLEATAYGVAGLEEKDFFVLHAGDPGVGGNISILAPGTGLGEAGLFWDGQCYHPFATEGGHCDYSCRNALDLELHDYPAAVRVLEQVYAKNPQSADALRDLANAFFLNENYAAALDAMGRLARLETPKPGSWFVRAICYDKLSRKVEALDSYQKFLDQDGGQHDTQDIQARHRILLLQREIGQTRKK
jgi:tetratricopeptide (TPR) repeat protein